MTLEKLKMDNNLLTSFQIISRRKKLEQKLCKKFEDCFMGQHENEKSSRINIYLTWQL